MKAVHLRPLCIFCLSFYFASVFMPRGGAEKLWIAGALLAFAVVLLVIYLKRDRGMWLRSISILLGAVAASSAFTYAFIDLHARQDRALAGEREIRGRITEVLYSKSYGSAYLAKLTEIDGEECNVTARLECSEYYERGDVFFGEGILCEIEPGEDSNYYFSNGIYLECTENQLRYEGSYPTLFDRMYHINNVLTAKLVTSLGEESGGIAATVFLGNDAFLPVRFDVAMRNMGITHLTALSGMHLSVICGILTLILGRLGRRIALAGTLVPVAFYVVLTGCSASIVRAGVMLVCLSVLYFMGRDADMMTDLAMTVALICVFDRYAVYDIGLQLSAVSIIGIAAALRITAEDIYHPSGKVRKGMRRVLLPFCIGFFAMIFTMPFVVHYFGSFSPAAFILTVPFSLLVTLVMWLAPLVLLFGNIPFAGGYFIYWCKAVCRALYGSASEIGFHNGWTVTESSIFINASMVLLVLAVCVTAVLDTKKQRCICSIVAAALLAVFATVTAVTVNVNLSKVAILTAESAVGDEIAIRHRDARVLIDVSKGTGSSADGLCKTASMMSISTADVLIITDPHKDHVESVARMRLYMDIKAVLLPDTPEARDVGGGIGGKVEYYLAGEELDFGEFSIVTYEDKYISRSVVPIIRLDIVTEDDSFTYLGSAFNEVDTGYLSCDWLWLGAYGPKYKKQAVIIPFDNILVSSKVREFIPLEPTFQTGEKIYLTD